MAGPKSVLEMVHICKTEIAEENDRATSFREKSCLVADTFTCVSNCYRK